MDKVYFSEDIIREYGALADMVKVKTSLEGFQKIQNGEVEFFVSSSRNRYLIRKYRLSEISPKYTFFNYTEKFGMAIRPDWPIFVSILNKTIDSFSQQEVDAIVAKWAQLPEQKKIIEMTAREQAWLEQNHTVRVRAVDWPPYLIIKDNEPPQGIVIEYLKLIEERTGITFNYEVTDQPFAEFLEQIQHHQGPDMTALIVQSPEREQYLSFTAPALSSP